ncbi:Alpha/beta hydrolase domain-containing protein 4 [Perkinsus chesapeaki]|uniref:Alpha/beta hydrolase domain-containing protein 4 n=1 Tax=Perkinsus chesapeaki TaxID=330153 RepID=A0A7J6L6N5_PERCH|nr:Alpha/beta hydrolase domain-containing protein 4 [Perkinsus chesapeaki]
MDVPSTAKHRSATLLDLPEELLLNNMMVFLPTIPTLLQLQRVCTKLMHLIRSSPSVIRYVDLTNVPRTYANTLTYLILLGNSAPSPTESLGRLVPGRLCGFTETRSLTLPDLNLLIDPPFIGPISLQCLKCRSYAMTSWTAIEVLLAGLSQLTALDLAIQVSSGPPNPNWLSRHWQRLAIRIRIYPGWAVSYGDLVESVTRAVTCSQGTLKDFRFYGRCTDQELKRLVCALGACKRLTQIGLSDIRAVEAGSILPLLGDVRQLKHLSLAGSCGVGHEIFAGLCRTNLIYLNLKGTKRVDLQDLLGCDPLMASLSILKLPAVKTKALTALLNLLEKCRNLRRLEIEPVATGDESIRVAMLLVNSFTLFHPERHLIKVDPDVFVTADAYEHAREATEAVSKTFTTSDGHSINFVETGCCASQKQEKMPIQVLCHGWGSGLAFFFENIDSLAAKYQLYLPDWLGMGGSSRPSCPKAPRVSTLKSLFEDSITKGERLQTPEIDFFLVAFLEWLDHITIDEEPVVLVGHSLGGYLATCFAIRYPHRVSRLVLLSPIGLPVAPPKQLHRRPSDLPKMLRLVDAVWNWNLTPQRILRLSGGWGRDRVKVVVERRFEASRSGRWGDLEKGLIAEYLYQISAAPGSGEYAMNSLLHPVAWEGIGGDRLGHIYARIPLHFSMKNRLSVPTLVLFGDNDWVCTEDTLFYLRRVTEVNSRVKLKIISSSGHHLYLDNSVEVNSVILSWLATYPEMSHPSDI